VTGFRVAAQIARVVVLAGRRLLVVGDERYVETALLGDGGGGLWVLVVGVASGTVLRLEGER
jgi:hypothetical protein